MKTLKQLSKEEQIEARIVRVKENTMVRDAVLVIAFAFAGYMLWRMAVRE